MGTSDEVLIDKMDKTILKLEQPTQGTCPAHGPLAEGVSLLLQIQRTTLDSKPSGNFIQYGKLTIGGSFAIAVIAVGYIVLRFLGIAP